MRLKVFMLVGIPASGKSTWAERFIDKCRGETNYISSDRIREKLFGDVSDTSHNAEVFLIMREEMARTLNRGEDVILDATFVKARERSGYIKTAKDLGAGVWAVYFKTSLPTALQRNQERQRKVPEQIINKRFSELEEPDEAEGFEAIIIAGDQE